MRSYTSVGIKKSTKEKLSEVKKELDEDTYDEMIRKLISFWKRERKREER